MARYTCLYTLAVRIEELQSLLAEMLEASGFDVIYHTSDYMMARETPGQVSFAQLVTIEVLIDRTKASREKVQMSLVAKNEELPLQVDNHCYQLFAQVVDAIAANPKWQLLESTVGSFN
jgi:hypothetical protein